MAPPAFALVASPDGGSGEGSGAAAPGLDGEFMDASLAHAGDESPRKRLDTLLHRKSFQHRHEIPNLLYQLDSDEKAEIRSSQSYRALVADALKKQHELMTKSLAALEMALPDKVLWLVAWHKASNPGMPINYDLFRPLILRASQDERNQLAADGFKAIFMRSETEEGGPVMILNDLGFDLPTKLQWYKEQQAVSARFSHIWPWFQADPAAAQSILEDSNLKVWLAKLCDPAEILKMAGLAGWEMTEIVELLQERAKKTPVKLTQPQVLELLKRPDTELGTLLESAELLSFFVQQIPTDRMINDLLQSPNMQLGAQIRLLNARFKEDGMGLVYSSIRPLVIAAGKEERTALASETFKAIIVKACDENTIFGALDDLQFPLSIRVSWIAAINSEMATHYGHGPADYSKLAPMVRGAEGEDREFLQTIGGQDQVLGLGGAEHGASAMRDMGLKLSLKDKMLRLLKTAGMAAVQDLVNGEPQSERDKVWKNAKLMKELEAAMGIEDYLTLCGALRMRFTGATPTQSALEADKLIQASLGKYVTIPVKDGRTADGHVAVVDNYHWNLAGKNHYGGEWPKTKDTIAGFVDAGERGWVNASYTNEGTMIHESVHRYSANGPEAFIYLSQPLNEGVTEYFTRKVIADSKQDISRDSYDDNYKCVQKLVKLVGEEIVANAFFLGETEALMKAYCAKKKKTEKDWNAFLESTKSKDWTTANAQL